MKKTKLITLVILSAFLFGIVGSAVAYQEYLYEWEDEGEGDTHGGCHGSAGTMESTNGALVLSINETGNLAPLQAFTLEVLINNFTEALEDPYTRSGAGRVTLGVPGYLGDNARFTSSLAHQTLNRGEKLDDWGSYDPSDTDNEFMLNAPNEAGVYVLWAVVIAGMNQSDATAANLTYIEGSITITVVAPVNGGGTDGGTIPGGILAITIGSVFVVTTIIILKKKNILKKK